MTTFILILHVSWWYNHSTAMIAPEFSSKEACEHALTITEKQFTSQYYIKGFCVPK